MSSNMAPLPPEMNKKWVETGRCWEGGPEIIILNTSKKRDSRVFSGHFGIALMANHYLEVRVKHLAR